MSNRGGARKGAGRKRNKESRFIKRITDKCELFIKDLLSDDLVYQRLLLEDRQNEKNNRKFENKKKDYLYIIESNAGFKVGYTTNIESRIKNYKTYLSDFDVVFVHNGDDCFEIESYMHEYFRSKKISGEWFELSDSDLVYIVKYCNAIYKE